MTDIIPFKNNSELKEKAKDLYFAGIYPSEIADELGITFEELGLQIFGHDGMGKVSTCWHHELQERRKMGTLVHTGAYIRVKPVILKQVEASMMKLIKKSVESKLESGEVMEMDDVNKLMGSVEKVDRITRLEEGKATKHEALEIVHLDQREIQEMRKERTKFMNDSVKAEFEKMAEDQDTDI